MAKLATGIEVARRFDVHIDTVRRWVREAKIPCIRPTERTIRFDLRAVEESLCKPISGAGTKPKK